MQDNHEEVTRFIERLIEVHRAVRMAKASPVRLRGFLAKMEAARDALDTPGVTWGEVHRTTHKSRMRERRECAILSARRRLQKMLEETPVTPEPAMKNNLVEVSVHSLATSLLKARIRQVKALRGLKNSLVGYALASVEVSVQLGRPSLPLIRGVVRVMEGQAELLEGLIGTFDAVTKALPGIAKALKDAQDARGAVPVEILDSAVKTEEFLAAKKELEAEESGPVAPKNTKTSKKKFAIEDN